MNLSFIIVNYNSKKFLENCIDSILSQVGKLKIEIIIVNNDPSESLSFSLPEVKIIDLEKNVGYAKANNIGLSISQGKFVCFLNPDTKVVDCNFTELLSKFKIDPDIGIIAPKIISEDGNPQKWSNGNNITLASTVLNKFLPISCNYTWNAKAPIYLEWVSGAAFFAHRELMDKLRGFDEEFFMYFEDVDLCKRVKDKGKKILFLPQHIILHFGGQSFSSKSRQKKLYYESQDKFYRKHFGVFTQKCIKILRKIFINSHE